MKKFVLVAALLAACTGTAIDNPLEVEPQDAIVHDPPWAPVALLQVKGCPGGACRFDASRSEAAPGHTLVLYRWIFERDYACCGFDTVDVATPYLERQYQLSGDWLVILSVFDETGAQDNEVDFVHVNVK